MTLQDAQLRLPWISSHEQETGILGSIAATALAFAVAVIVLFVAGEAQACRTGTVQGASAALETMQAIAKAPTVVIHAISPGKDLRGTPEMRATGTEGNVHGCCASQASGAACSGNDCASCGGVVAPAGIAAYVPGAIAGCLWSFGTSVAAPSPDSLFRPPRRHT